MNINYGIFNFSQIYISTLNSFEYEFRYRIKSNDFILYSKTTMKYYTYSVSYQRYPEINWAGTSHQFPSDVIHAANLFITKIQ